MVHYSPVSSKASFNDVELSVLEFWQKNNIFEQSLEQNKNNSEYVFFEGPPTANGKPGIHHVLARTFKDLVCRYQTMNGFLVQRRAGWDEHGLPVEIEVQKQNNLKSKSDIEEFGVNKFNQLCAESTQKYIGEWEKLTQRMAYWVDFESAYRTSDSSYISSIWGIIKSLYDKNLLYQGHKIVPWACDSGTTVSQAEVALGYKDVIDETVYVKFQLSKDATQALGVEGSLYMVAWTTTPWTLPSNMALAVGYDIEYSVVQNTQTLDHLIMSSQRFEKVCDSAEYTIVGKYTGKDLLEALAANNTYYNLFDDELSALGIHGADFVEDSGDIGTGIVHIAPAFGQDDYNLYQSLNTQVEIVNYVTPQGVFTQSAPEIIAGQSLFNEHKKTKSLELARINAIISKYLQGKGLILRTEKYEHSYPHNWRTGNPLIYYLRPSWYVATSQLKDKMSTSNQSVNWYPGHLRDGRFGKWLENNVDWSISRERYWGTPLPIWVGDQGSIRVIGSIEELEQYTGSPVVDPHKHIVDRITWIDGDTGETFTRVPEVLDCWFDSGAMPIASYGEFANNSKVADYICEAIDQTRGWFYSLLAVSTALGHDSPYKNVLCLGHILDGDGQKMSKSKGNIVEPWEVFDKFGADAVRWYFINNSIAGNPIRFSVSSVNEVIRGFFLQLWNTYAFFVMYANLDNISPESLYKNQENYQLTNLDRWILSSLKTLIFKVSDEYSQFEFAKATSLIQDFVDKLSNVWVRSNRNRFWNTDPQASVDLGAYYVLNKCLLIVSQLSAPCIPLISESIYQNLQVEDMPASVHLTQWLTSEEVTPEESALEEEMIQSLDILNQARNLRQQYQLKIRQPLQALYLPVSYRGKVNSFKDFILQELNIKEIQYKDIENLDIEQSLTRELLSEGYARDFIHSVQNLRKQMGFDVADRINLFISFGEETETKELLSLQKNYIMTEVLALQWEESTELASDSSEIKLRGAKIQVFLEKE